MTYISGNGITSMNVPADGAPALPKSAPGYPVDIEDPFWRLDQDSHLKKDPDYRGKQDLDLDGYFTPATDGNDSFSLTDSLRSLQGSDIGTFYVDGGKGTDHVIADAGGTPFFDDQYKEVTGAKIVSYHFTEADEKTGANQGNQFVEMNANYAGLDGSLGDGDDTLKITGNGVSGHIDGGAGHNKFFVGVGGKGYGGINDRNDITIFANTPKEDAPMPGKKPQDSVTLEGQQSDWNLKQTKVKDLTLEDLGVGPRETNPGKDAILQGSGLDMVDPDSTIQIFTNKKTGSIVRVTGEAAINYGNADSVQGQS